LLAPPLQRLVTELGKLPGIGNRTAQRLAFHILRTSAEDANALAEAIDPEESELLADMVQAAVNEALRSAQERAGQKMGGITGGLGGGPGGLGGLPGT